eukprot:2623125-Heterocapsa_arctica.AAC.2
MIDVDAANFTKGLPKETSESISQGTMIKLSGNIFRKSALVHVMEGDGVNTLKSAVFGTYGNLFKPACPTPMAPQVIREVTFPQLLETIQRDGPDDMGEKCHEKMT